MVVTNKLYSPQEFVEILTGKYYIFNGINDIDDIHTYLYVEGIETEEQQLWDYALDEIDHVIEHDLPIVLVKVLVEDDDGNLQSEVRWFEIPAECVANFEEV